jgi:transcription elongation factor Spt5
MKQYIVNTTVGREAKVIEDIRARINGSGSFQRKKSSIGALHHAEHLHGYIFIEAEEEHLLEEVLGLIRSTNLTRIRNVKGIVGEIPVDVVQEQLQPRNPTEDLDCGMIVTILSGPLKNSRAMIYAISEKKQTVSMELHDEQIRIPIVDFPASKVRRV